MTPRPANEPAAERLFFALWPKRHLADDLARCASKIQAATGGRRTCAEDLHLTLAFLGAIPPDRVRIARTVADEIKREAFFLQLDRLVHGARLLQARDHL